MSVFIPWIARNIVRLVDHLQPRLRCVKIKADGNHVHITATDGVIATRATYLQSGEAPCDTWVHYVNPVNWRKEFAGDKESVKLVNERLQLNNNSLSIRQKPEFPDKAVKQSIDLILNPVHWISVDARVLQKALDMAKLAGDNPDGGDARPIRLSIIRSDYHAPVLGVSTIGSHGDVHTTIMGIYDKPYVDTTPLSKVWRAAQECEAAQSPNEQSLALGVLRQAVEACKGKVF